MKYHGDPGYYQEIEWFPISRYRAQHPHEYVLISTGEETLDPDVRPAAFAMQNERGEWIPMFTHRPYEGAKYFARVALPFRRRVEAA